jgi:ribosomal-protein-alanine N-acetyltransferase
VDLELRRWTTGDAAALRRATVTSPDLALQLGDVDLGTEVACARFIDRQWASPTADRLDRAISVDGVAVGHVGLSHIEHRHDTAWVSYWVAETFRGRGLATWGLIALTDHAFRELGLFRVELGHRTDNIASCRVAVRAGFTAEGIERSRLRYGDLRFDVETHARLVTDPDVSYPGSSSGGTFVG